MEQNAACLLGPTLHLRRGKVPDKHNFNRSRRNCCLFCCRAQDSILYFLIAGRLRHCALGTERQNVTPFTGTLQNVRDWQDIPLKQNDLIACQLILELQLAGLPLEFRWFTICVEWLANVIMQWPRHGSQVAPTCCIPARRLTNRRCEGRKQSGIGCAWAVRLH